jgi:hypothetical protein
MRIRATMSDVSDVSDEITRHEGTLGRGNGKSWPVQQPLGLNSCDDDSGSRQPLPRMIRIK